jgi:Skp family chaperone for outer membrane proteins
MSGFVPDPQPFDFESVYIEREAHKQLNKLKAICKELKSNYSELQKKYSELQVDRNDAVIEKNALLRVMKEEIAAGNVDEDSAFRRYQQHVEEQEKQLRP